MLISARSGHFRFRIPASILVSAKVWILLWITNIGNAGIGATQAIHFEQMRLILGPEYDYKVFWLHSLRKEIILCA